jgi:DNA invertase Pin-like site-specific DNA recombinase
VTAKPNAAIYVRISDDREGAGLGVARQEKDCRELAKRLRWTVTDVYIDNDYSAYSGKRRPEYERLLEDIRAGSVDRILIWHTDRLHRRPVELEEYVALCERHGIITQTVRAGELDLATPSGRFAARMLGAAARHESEHKADRNQRKHQEIAEKGRPNGGLRPFGWYSDRITLDPAEHAIIKECARRLLSGESLRAVAADLNVRGIRTVTGKPWSPTVLRAMMLRPRMAGLREHHGEIIGKAVWQRALPRSIWDELRALFADPQRKIGANARRWLLTGIAQCPAGHRMTTRMGSRARSDASRTSYACPACRIYRAAGPLDIYVTESVLLRLGQLQPEPPPPVDKMLAAEIESVRERIAEADEMYAGEIISGEQYARTSRLLRVRLAEMEKRAIPPRRRRLTKGLTKPDNWAAWGKLSLDRQRAIVAELVEVIVHPAGVGRRAFRPETVELGWK